MNASKYIASAALGFAEGFNTLTAASETRTWNDLDGNRSVLDAQGNLQRNEILGGTANFGQASSVDRLDPGLRREYNWEYGASIQHELFPRVSVTGGYHRRTYGNLAVTDNQNLSASEWTPFTILAPADPRLPDGGGFPIELWTLNTNKVGTPTDNLRTFSTLNTRVYNGVDVTVSGRLGDSAFFLGGVTTEKLATNGCDGRARQSQQPALLRADIAVPHAVQAVRRLPAALRFPGERQLHDAARRRHLRRTTR